MARLLKTYVTSIGFFDLAVAAPSMKAALETWGAGSNLFHQGFAKETNDPTIVSATMAHPGVVLKRPVGSNDGFKLVAELPKGLSGGRRDVVAPARPAPSRKTPKRPARAADEKAVRQAAFAFEEEQKRREKQRQEEEAARDKLRKRRAQAVAKAEAALKKAEEAHRSKVAEIDKDRAALDKRSAAEDQRWKKQRDKLQADLRQARD